MTDRIPERFTISFGALAPSIPEQIQAAGLDFVGKVDIDLLVSIDRAITLLTIHRVLSDGECDRARRRLMKKIKRCVRKKISKP